MIKDMGAIILFKTNVPQTLFAFECSNPIFGRTLNPFSSGYTCGGSSGGEAVALASNASALGFGSDIGGSLRIPAHYCGIYSLKPSSDRCPLKGHFGIVEGFEGVRVVSGPMARSLLDLKFITKIVLSSRPELYDFSCIPLPWRESLQSNNLKVFGYYFEDGFTSTSPACRRAVCMVVDALKASGHKVVEIRPPSSLDAVEIFIGLTSSDGYKEVYDFLKKDPMEKNLRLPILASWIPYFFKCVIGYVIENIICDPKFSTVFKAVGKKKTLEYYRLICRRNLYQKEWSKVWNNYKLDGIIAPSSPLPALPHDGTTSGIYSDINTEILLHASNWTSKSMKLSSIGLVIGIETDATDTLDSTQNPFKSLRFSTATIRAKPGHPILREIIVNVTREILQRQKNQNSLKFEKFTNSVLWTNIIFDYLLYHKVNNSSETKNTNILYSYLSKLNKEKVIEDIVILPVTSFSLNKRYISNKNSENPQAIIRHYFEDITELSS
ncbi:hypothetical protein PCK2_000635 [Pneumocystis canis]|nr:hypothetical protein PCK2_000635 [Pneumocystis canis]